MLNLLVPCGGMVKKGGVILSENDIDTWLLRSPPPSYI